MPRKYEEEYQLFISYIESQITSINEKLEKVDLYDKIRNAYNEIKARNYSKFLEYYDVLSKINSNLKENLDVIDYLVKNSITVAPQIDESIERILNDAKLLEIVSTTFSKEKLSTQKMKLTSVLDGTCDFEIFKDVLLNSNMDIEGIICILTEEAQKSTVSNGKKELPSLDENNEQNEEIISKYNKVISESNELIDKYYYLIEQKPPSLIGAYKKTINSVYNLTEIEQYGETDVVLCLFILKLIKLKDESDFILKNKPVDYELLEVCINELIEQFNYTKQAAINYDIDEKYDLPLDSTIYYLLDENGKPLFDIEDFSNEEKKNINALLSDLEMGLYDYERNKGMHTRVKQSERKDLKVFVNNKRNTSVSFIRINSSDLKDSKVLVLSIDNNKKIFDSSTSILKTQSYLIDESITQIKENNSEFMSEQNLFKETLKEMISREEVPSK